MKSLAKLADQRLGPINEALERRDDLPALRHLIVVPSPAMAGIPIEALLDARHPGSPRYVVSYAPSGTMFAWLQERRRGSNDVRGKTHWLLAIGDPLPPAEAISDAVTAQRDITGLARISRGPSFERLPGSALEVEAIARLFEEKVVLLRSDATEQRLREIQAHGEFTRFSIIHLATHGKMDDVVPMNSRLVLSRIQLPDPASTAIDQLSYDGIVTAGEVMSTWKIDAELVTLSACQTGLGRNGGGEGFIGFAQAFFLAGARSLIVSLWEVDDQATSLLMSRFYQNWLGRRDGLSGPMSKAEALRQAKEWLRALTTAQVHDEIARLSRGEPRRREGLPVAAHPFDHPHYWAAFILMGDPN
jgi:CHAT domain-containing protein